MYVKFIAYLTSFVYSLNNCLSLVINITDRMFRYGKVRQNYNFFSLSSIFILKRSEISHIFGSWVDVHSGGIDLLFPHHENEEAQCCAYHGISQWVGHWIHSSKWRIHINKMLFFCLYVYLSTPPLPASYIRSITFA